VLLLCKAESVPKVLYGAHKRIIGHHDPAHEAASTPTAKEVWNCKRDEGRSLGAGEQEQAPNHCELLALRALVASVAGKGGK
jgi:hypothetical protein